MKTGYALRIILKEGDPIEFKHFATIEQANAAFIICKFFLAGNVDKATTYQTSFLDEDPYLHELV